MPSLPIPLSSDNLALDIRALTGAEDRRKAFAVFRQALLGLGDFGRKNPDLETRYLAGGALLGGFENDALRGVVNGYESEIVVPGGQRVRHLSVTHVGVAPQATRRGIARRLIVEQLRRARADGYVVAGLRASDTGIYGRYGYGIASWSVRHDLDLKRSEFSAGVPREGIRVVEAEDSFPLLRRIAETDPTPRPATLSRWDGWWAIQEHHTINSTVPRHTIVFGREGEETGFLRFHVQNPEDWFPSSQRTVVVDDLVAHDDETWRALIGHLFAQDIVHRAVFPSRPVDDPLPLALSNPRALTISGQRDETWLRILDLQALFAARRFGGARQVAVQVDDALFPQNAGVWSIGARGAERTSERPEARVAVEDLATLLFGTAPASHLVAAHRIHASNPLVAEELDIILGVSRRPHSGISF